MNRLYFFRHALAIVALIAVVAFGGGVKQANAGPLPGPDPFTPLEACYLLTLNMNMPAGLPLPPDLPGVPYMIIRETVGIWPPTVQRTFAPAGTTVTYAVFLNERDILTFAGPFGSATVFSNFPMAGGAATATRVDGSFCRGMTDGRMNMDDQAALAAIYPSASGFDVYAINGGTGEGVWSFSVTMADIDAALAAAAANGAHQMINGDEARGIGLYALTDGQCQLNYFSVDGHLREFRFACGS
jgi:hypothetical protein